MPPTTTNTPTSPATVTPISPIPASSSQATTASITPAPASTSTTIPTSNLTAGQSLALPAAQPSSGALPAASNIGTVAALNQNQNALVNETSANEGTAQENYNSAQGTLTGLMNQYLNEGSDELNMENSAGIPGLQQSANDLTNQYNTTEQSYNAQYDAIVNTPGASLEDSANQISDLQQQRGYALTNLGIQQSVAQNNYTNAMNLVQNQIQIKYAPLKDVIDYQEQIMNNAQGLLTQEQSQQFQANLQVQQQQYTNSTYYSQLNATTGMQMIQDAAKNGADPTTLQNMSTALSSGGTISDIAGAAGSYLTTGSYSLQLNPSTGQLGILNANTGQYSDGTSGVGPIMDSGTATSSVTAPNGSTYNFAASGYNTADPNYNLKVNANVASITSQFGAVTTPQVAQAVISQIAPTSQVTGQMVMTAAQQAGIDPTVLLAQMQEESGCGTSNVAVNNNNCGGVNFASQPGATKGTAQPGGGNYAKFDTLQDGLDAQAALIAKAKQTPTANTTGQTPETQYSLKTITALKSALPQNIGNAINFMASTGDGYIDMSKVTDMPGYPAGYAATQAENYAKQYGLAVLTGDQASSMQDADTALTQINNIQSAWNSVAPTSSVADLLGISGGVNAFDMMTKNTQSVALTKYMNMVPTAISTLNAITGSKRLSAFSSTLSTDALPTLSGLKSGDTLAQGNAKLDALRQDINASITPIISTSNGAPLSTSFVTIRTPSGAVGQIPGSNLEEALSLGATEVN
jgi:hypothetical protein